jgi:hypothetical protein
MSEEAILEFARWEAAGFAGEAWEGSACRRVPALAGPRGDRSVSTEIAALASPILPRSTERAEAALGVQTEALIFQ